MHEHFDAHKAFEHIEELAAERRMAGTAGELAARSYIRLTAGEFGLEMRDEEFSYSDLPFKVAVPATCVLIGSLSMVGSLTYLWNSWTAAIAGAILLFVVWLSLKWSDMFDRLALRGRKRSANLIGEVPSEGGGDAAGLIILSAHYDSKSQVMPVLLRASFFILGFGIALAFGVWLLAAGILSAAGVRLPGNVAVFWSSMLVPALMLALIFNFSRNTSPGALDDASGVALILEIARCLASRPLEAYDVRIAAFGCEELGLCGSISHLAAHEEELRARGALMLNFDMPFTSSGKVSVNTGFEFPRVKTSERLNGLIYEAGAEMGIEVQNLYIPVGAGVDHMPWVKHGMEATGMVCASAHVHSSHDTADRVNREGLRRAGEITLAVLRKLDQEASSASSTNGSGAGAAATGLAPNGTSARDSM